MHRNQRIWTINETSRIPLLQLVSHSFSWKMVSLVRPFPIQRGNTAPDITPVYCSYLWTYTGVNWYAKSENIMDCNLYINRRDTQILVNSLYFFIKWLYMFRTIISPSSGATFNKLYSATDTCRYVWLLCGCRHTAARRTGRVMRNLRVQWTESGLGSEDSAICLKLCSSVAISKWSEVIRRGVT